MTILVTGGAGFIGSHTAQALRARGDTVIIVDDFNDYYSPAVKHHNISRLQAAKPCKVYDADIRNYGLLHEMFRSERIDKVCHLAARAGVRASIADPFLYEQTNILGTLHLLKLAADFKVKNFVYASSSSVYGNMPTAPFREDMKLDEPISPYAATKKACELMAYTYHHLCGLPCTGLRFFTVFGPAGRPDMAPFIFAWNIMHGIPIRKFGTGGTQRDYTYIDDIVAGVLAAIDRDLPFEIINLGNCRPITLTTMIETIERVVGKTAGIEQAGMQPGDVEMTCADIAKAQRLLGYEPRTSFEEGMARFAAWLKDHARLYD